MLLYERTKQGSPLERPDQADNENPRECLTFGGLIQRVLTFID